MRHKPLLLSTYQGRNHMDAKILGTLAVVALLAACSSNQPAANAAPAAPTSVGIVPGSQEDLVANVGDRIYFDYNRSNVSGTGARTANNASTLGKQAAWLQKYPQNNVQVAGNCDERGTEEYNLALGQRRADADAAYLKAHGIAAGRITTISYGKDRPVALGSNEDAWSQNRNATTSVR
jgi:peptidoglycan-associated lipoprotein